MNTTIPGRHKLFLFLLLIAGMMIAAVFSPIVRADTLTVTTTDDDVTVNGNCTLREAVIAANTDTAVDACPAGDGPDTVTLPAGDYVLTLAGANENDALTGDLDVTDDLTITGAGRGGTVIDGSGLDQVFEIWAPAAISHVSITNGDTSPTFDDGGIVVRNALTLSNSRVHDNVGSGIRVGSFDSLAELTLIDSRIDHNAANYFGGGIYNFGTTIVVNSVVDSNTAWYGAGIHNRGTLTLVNSTVSSNNALLNGGGIMTDWGVISGGTTDLYNTTITNNATDFDNGGGVYIDSAGVLNTWNSIIAGNFDNSSGAQEPDCSGTLNSQGYNLVQSLAGCTITGDTTGNITGVGANLSPLQNNGGPTRSHALLGGSPAIDAGNPADCVDAAGAPLRRDQRGYIRPADGGGGSRRCDIGAYEYNSPGLPPTTIIVERTSDFPDRDPGDGRCDVSVNSGDQCGLRAALEELNALGAGMTPYHITFDLSGNGPHTFTPASPLPEIIVPVVIDGESQAGAVCPSGDAPAALQIVLDGSNAGDSHGLVLTAGSNGSAIRGLVVGNFQRDGIRLLSDRNSVTCSHIGLAADGLAPLGNDGTGIWTEGDSNVIGGPTADAERNVISGNGAAGVRIESGVFTVIANNFVGTTADGLASLGNLGGITVAGASAIVGSTASLSSTSVAPGTSVTAANVISGNNGYGIRVTAEAATIMGNVIGLARDGLTPLPNSGSGIEILGGAVDVTVGGLGSGEANRIAHNGGSGVILFSNANGAPSRDRLRGNTIFANNGLGIDLGFDGVDVNDSGDGDGGENDRQNSPMLIATLGSTAVGGTLNSRPNVVYQIDVYRSNSCDLSGYGEGQEYLMTRTVATDGTGQAAFALVITGPSPGDAITATATDEEGNTSEFSNCVTLEANPGAVHSVFLPLVVK